MLTPEDIEAGGFREFPVNKFSGLRSVSRFWQKAYRTTDNQKKQYFINIEQWDFTKYDQSVHPYGYEASGQFNRGNDETFNVELLSPKSIEQVETFFYDIFLLMGCKAVDD